MKLFFMLCLVIKQDWRFFVSDAVNSGSGSGGPFSGPSGPSGPNEDGLSLEGAPLNEKQKEYLKTAKGRTKTENTLGPSPLRGKIDSVERLRDEIFLFVSEYFEIFSGEVCRMTMLTARFNKLASRFDTSVREIVRSDERFLVRVNKRGGTLVAPRAQLKEYFLVSDDPVEAEARYWEANYGVPRMDISF